MNNIRNDYGQYATADFLHDQDFLAWVKYPTAESNAYWAAVGEQHPQKTQQMHQARGLILLLNSPVLPPVQDGGDRVWSRIADAMKEPVVRKISPWRSIAAASILLVITAGFFIFRQAQPQKAVPAAAIAKNDALPGKNMAVLTLANGQKVMLDSTGNGLLAREGNTSIRKAANGELIYEGADESEVKVHINRIDIPRGAQYRLTLPDGTKIWLNAASSLQFPSSFTGKDRTVELNGEAYFEVAADPEKPFRVISGHQSLDVLGTHFNINSYEEEDAVRTTLLQGSVRLTNTLQQASRVLQPGQQAAMFRGNKPMRIINADMEEVMAWKEGYFIWNNEPIESIMRKLSRWYDIQPVYEKPLPDIGLSGMMSRSKSLPEVLKDLETTGTVHFRIEGRNVVITR
ncbi:FecR domain-containing protein [Chitinophaga niabensis]|uniref:FecR domain-containing protein n=1 Tax=Chitinophaga niabensis TaxID=536979 RepID=UPI0031BBB844